jgi:hypothetical protein
MSATDPSNIFLVTQNGSTQKTPAKELVESQPFAKRAKDICDKCVKSIYIPDYTQDPDNCYYGDAKYENERKIRVYEATLTELQALYETASDESDKTTVLDKITEIQKMIFEMELTPKDRKLISEMDGLVVEADRVIKKSKEAHNVGSTRKDCSKEIEELKQTSLRQARKNYWEKILTKEPLPGIDELAKSKKALADKLKAIEEKHKKNTLAHELKAARAKNLFHLDPPEDYAEYREAMGESRWLSFLKEIKKHKQDREQSLMVQEDLQEYEKEKAEREKRIDKIIEKTQQQYCLDLEEFSKQAQQKLLDIQKDCENQLKDIETKYTKKRTQEEKDKFVEANNKDPRLRKLKAVLDLRDSKTLFERKMNDKRLQKLVKTLDLDI